MASPFTGREGTVQTTQAVQAARGVLVPVGRLSLVLRHLAVSHTLVRAPGGRRGIALCGACPVFDQPQLDYMAGRPVPLTDASLCDLCRAAAERPGRTGRTAVPPSMV